MRDPGKEPLEMLGGDVVELTKMVYAEREAWAAEVAVYREAIGHSLGFHAHLHGDECPCSGCTALRAALAAPPNAAAQAVEAMRKALECQKCYCAYAVNPQDMSAAALESGAESELVQQCARCAALAAWKEATRG